MSSQKWKRKRSLESSIGRVSSIEEVNDADRYRFDAEFAPDCDALARQLISAIHGIGRNEPSSSILRLSTHLDEQNPDEQTLLTLWPTADLGDINQQQVFAVTSKNPRRISKYPEFCLFVVDKSSITDMVQSGKTPKSVAEWWLQTRRLRAKPGKLAQRGGWNNTDVKARDGNLSDMLTKLLGHIENSMKSSSQCDTQSANGRSSRPLWSQGDVKFPSTSRSSKRTRECIWIGDDDEKRGEASSLNTSHKRRRP